MPETALHILFANFIYWTRRLLWIALLSIFATAWLSVGVEAQAVSPDITNTSPETNTMQNASVGNYVWEDTNVDGIQGFQPAENPIAGVVVSLYHASGLLADMTITDSDGEYSFQYLAPGDYYLGFSAPNLMVATVINQGDDPDMDSDIDAITGLTSVFTLEAGEENQSIDVGFTHAATLSSWVWHDENADGVREKQQERGVPATILTLYDEFDQIVQSVPTDADGYFSFPAITPGAYRIGVTPPPGMTYTTSHTLRDNTLGSDVDPRTGRTGFFQVYPGPNSLNRGIGLIRILAPAALDTAAEPLRAPQLERHYYVPLISHSARANIDDASPFSWVGAPQ